MFSSKTSKFAALGAAVLGSSALAFEFKQPEAEVTQCPGSLDVQGVGQLSVLATKKNMPWFRAAPVAVQDGKVVPEMWGRAYLAHQCTEGGSISNNDYVAWELLGKTLTYTTDLSAAGCGCNVAFYLVSMKQNPEVSGCDDYYCDANSVCGIRCEEIDIQEANIRAWHSALHIASDGGGVAQGLGGWVLGNEFEMTVQEYGPNGQCIDTLQPFQVSVSFPVNEQGNLIGMTMKLHQEGKPCTIDYAMSDYYRDPNLETLTRALREGMTPTMSYWKSTDMTWLDGDGLGSGMCQLHEEAASCGEGVSFWDLKVENMADGSTFYP